MICHKCGRKIPENKFFCEYCYSSDNNAFKTEDLINPTNNAPFSSGGEQIKYKDDDEIFAEEEASRQLDNMIYNILKQNKADEARAKKRNFFRDVLFNFEDDFLGVAKFFLMFIVALVLLMFFISLF